jgi:hypothetical protein
MNDDLCNDHVGDDFYKFLHMNNHNWIILNVLLST